MAYMRLGDLLLSSGVISHEQLERALETRIDEAVFAQLMEEIDAD